MNKTALITGVAGQDGSYLADLLLAKNYRVFGLIRNNQQRVAKNLVTLQDKIEFLCGDLNEPDNIYSIINRVQPDEIYNLASQSYPGESWYSPFETTRTNAIGAHLLFNTVKLLKLNCKVYQASSSEMYGETINSPQCELTPFNPSNPYAAAKLYAHNMAKIYRKSYGMFISCGILFNHESERRGIHFITQKVSYAAACLKLGIKNSAFLNEKGDPIVKNGKLLLGNLNAQRDWGFAGDYVKAMWLMLQQDNPDDFVIGTGKIRTIRDLCKTAFSYVDLDWEKYVEVDPSLVRPIDTGPTVADPSKAEKILGWKAETSFETLIASMVDKHLLTITNNA